MLLRNFIEATDPAALRTSLEEIPFIREPDAVAKAMGLFLDKEQDVDIRTLAVQKSAVFIAGDAIYITDCLRVLADEAEPASLRKSVLLVLFAFNFSSPVFRSLRSDFMVILRGLLDSPSAELRALAAEELAVNKDEVVQNRLLNGLKGLERPVVPKAKAIQLLSYDAHADYYPVVRQLLQDPDTNKAAKVEAIHALAFDPESKPLLAALFNDRKQAKEIRMSSAVAFQAAHPDEFIELAKPVIVDEKEGKDIRAVSLNALMHHRNAGAVYNDEQFLEKVSQIKDLKSTRELKKLSGQYLKNAVKFRNQ